MRQVDVVNSEPIPPVQSNIPSVVRLVLHKQSKVLEIELEDGTDYRLPFELLRVYSPSAEVRGHGAGQAVLQVGKRAVNVLAVEPIGQYAVKLVFSDGHDTGLFTWPYLVWLGMHQDKLWVDYEARLQAAGASRDLVSVAVGGTVFVEHHAKSQPTDHFAVKKGCSEL